MYTPQVQPPLACHMTAECIARSFAVDNMSRLHACGPCFTSLWRPTLSILTQVDVSSQRCLSNADLNRNRTLDFFSEETGKLESDRDYQRTVQDVSLAASAPFHNLQLYEIDWMSYCTLDTSWLVTEGVWLSCAD